MFRRVGRDRYLSDAELQRFMAAVRVRRHVNQPRDHAFFALLANTGLRPSEVMRLTRADIQVGARSGWLRLCRLKKPHAAAPLNVLPLHPRVARIVGTFLASSEWQPTDKPFPFLKRQSARLFHYYARKASIDGYKVYSLRHSVGVRLWRHTRDLRMMQTIMGHVHLNATAGYVHVDHDAMQTAYEKMGGTE